MTSFRIERGPFVSAQIEAWLQLDPRFRNWPVVYALDGDEQIYVGESLNVATRFRQHLASAEKRRLKGARVVLDPTFNKSVCLDLEAFLIQRLSGDGTYRVMNRNVGISDRDYYGRADYQKIFADIFEELRRDGLFSHSLPEIENSDLFKLSPFKALTEDQEIVVLDILEGLFADIDTGVPSQVVVQGDPGTGKTVVAVYLMKLLSDVKAWDPSQQVESESPLAEFFVEGYPELLRDFRLGFIVPQMSLRKTIQRVFKRTPGLSPNMVMSPFEMGNAPEHFDVLIVDETHRLRQSGNQPAGPLYKMFSDINRRLFGADDANLTQLDWVKAKSTHQIYLMDSAQSIHTGDVPSHLLKELMTRSDDQHRRYRLTSQMRVQAGEDYVGYVRAVLSDQPPTPRSFTGYDLRFFDDMSEMRDAIRARDREVGLARLLAGFAWPWVSRRDKHAYDIQIDGVRMRWNRTDVDWVNSPTSLDEVGVIHTIQGYDLNYAGVIIGPDLRYDERAGRLAFDRTNYFDPTAANNMPRRGITFSDDEILKLVQNIYAVLLTRGMLGTYVYVCDRALRERLRPFFAAAALETDTSRFIGTD
ncbi:DNA/RNA helicase domain-containing protein [Pseudonocardia hispaniensis]|uniref:DNA/RNA helicase domain-containing protein n=1 Tax=Pseudonocardia hispaniensis TaxID=904933 RepID=A0ABW1IZZ8_9PSEU